MVGVAGAEVRFVVLMEVLGGGTLLDLVVLACDGAFSGGSESMGAGRS
jgi:hypothetical protein